MLELRTLRQTLRTYPDRSKFGMLDGAALIELEELPWEVDSWQEGELATVNLATIWGTDGVTIGSTLNCKLLQLWLPKNRRIRCGACHLDEVGPVVFSESLLGGAERSLIEVPTCIVLVVTIAGTYNGIIAAQFGGQRACDRLSQAFPEKTT